MPKGMGYGKYVKTSAKSPKYGSGKSKMGNVKSPIKPVKVK